MNTTWAVAIEIRTESRFLKIYSCLKWFVLLFWWNFGQRPRTRNSKQVFFIYFLLAFSKIFFIYSGVREWYEGFDRNFWVVEDYGNSHQSILLWNVSVSTLVHRDILLSLKVKFLIFIFFTFSKILKLRILYLTYIYYPDIEFRTSFQ